MARTKEQGSHMSQGKRFGPRSGDTHFSLAAAKSSARLASDGSSTKDNACTASSIMRQGGGVCHTTAASQSSRKREGQRPARAKVRQPQHAKPPGAQGRVLFDLTHGEIDVRKVRSRTRREITVKAPNGRSAHSGSFVHNTKPPVDGYSLSRYWARDNRWVAEPWL